jgi:Lrp/AsnC family leucine-responsive transcriptional regulator
MDELDRDILDALRQNCRVTNRALARRFSLSPSAMLARIKRLDSTGVILGYRAVVDPSKVGLSVHAVISVQLKEHGERCILDFEQAVREIPGVCACYHVSGQFDMILLLALPDLDHLSKLIRVDIARIPGVLRLETALIVGEAVALDAWPVFTHDQRGGDGDRRPQDEE